VERLRDRVRRWLPTLRTRRFDAAAGGRRWANTPTFGAINSEIGAAAGPVRRRASYYARNNPWIANGVNALVSGAVGAGIVPQSQHPDRAVREAIHRAWRAWTATADADGVTDAYGLMALAVRSMIENGETLAQLVPTIDGLRIRLLGPEMCPIDETRELEDGRRILQGIELAADGSRVAYWLHKTRPDVPSFSTELVRMPAEQMAHLFQPISPGQLRGVSALAPILLRLHELDVYEDSQLVRQKVSACFAGFLTDPTGSGVFSGDTDSSGVLRTGLEPGTLTVLPPGTDIRFSEPAQIGDAVPFLQLQLRSIAAGLGVPEYLLTGDLSQANYSSLRAALVEFRTRLEQLQYSVLVHQLCRPIWRAWITTEVLAGRLVGDLDELLNVEWIAPRTAWVDPQKDAEAARLALAAGLTSRRRETAALGWDIEQLDAEIAADQARERDLGLRFENGATPQPSQPQPLRVVPHAA
jgi:lambda family phage portal protein